MIENYNCKARTSSKKKKYKEKRETSNRQVLLQKQLSTKIKKVKEVVVRGFGKWRSKKYRIPNLGTEEEGGFRYRLVSKKTVINRSFNNSKHIGAVLTLGKVKYRVCALNDFEAIF